MRDMIRSKNDTRQLQFWNPSRRVYEPSAHQDFLDSDNVRSYACGRAWRIAKAERPLKPRYAPPSSSRSIYSVEEVQTRYLQWAADKRLTVITVFNNHPLLNRKKLNGGLIFTGEIRYIDPDEYFKVTEETTLEYDWLNLGADCALLRKQV